MDELTDFHPGEPDQKWLGYSYAVYLNNIRHSLNLLLRRPIKKKLTNNCAKLIIQVPPIPSPLV
jgi:hypothetical protein